MKKFLTGVTLLTTLILGACTNQNEVSKANLPVNTLLGVSSIDDHDLKQIVGDADYVFVAKVNDEIETLYKNKVTIEDGTKEIGDPYTKYSVTVIDNIKGKLKKNNKFDLLQVGGISEDKKSIVVFEDDKLFQVGKYNIMAAYAQPDGSLLVGGPNSSKELTETSIDKIASSETYLAYKKAQEEQIVTDRERFKSLQEE